MGSNPTPPAVRYLLPLILAGLVSCATPGEDPSRLNGTWRSGASGATLRILGHEWSLLSGELEKRGTVEVTPRRVAFVLEETNSPAFDLYCRDTVDVYDWFLDEQRAVFRTVGRPCDRAARAVLTAEPWTRA